MTDEQTNVAPVTNNSVSNSTPVVADTTQYECSIQCAIRRKAGMQVLPGQDPAEQVYRIGASLDGKTRGNLKGITGLLEQAYMPEVIGHSANDPKFRVQVEDYWSSIGKPVPPDEPFLKGHEMGIKISIRFIITGKKRKEKFEALNNVEEKIAYLKELLEHPLKDKSKNPVLAVLDSSSVSDFLMLSYCLLYSRVANSYADIHKSPKIQFYIFEKDVAVKSQLNSIDLRNKAMSVFQDLIEDETKMDAVLLMYGDNPREFETLSDKIIAIDDHYNKKPIDNMQKLVDFAGDALWETKYLIQKAIKLNKLKNPANTSSVYYGDQILGTTLIEAANQLNSEKFAEIKASLLKEINI